MIKRALLQASLLLGLGVPGLACKGSPQPAKEVGTVEAKRLTLNREVEAVGWLQPVKATRVTPPRDLTEDLKIVFIAEDGARVEQGDVLVRFDDSDFTRKFERQEFDGRGADAKLEKERTLARGLERDRARATNIAKREEDLSQRFQQKDEEIFSRHQILESNINVELQGTKVEHAQRAQGIETRISKTKVDLLSVDRTRADLEMQQARKALGKLELLAPHAGTFVLERNGQGETVRVGDVVRPRDTIAKIPLLDAMEAEVFVLEADADGLEPGRKATFVLDAAPNRVFSGTVKRVESIAKRRYSGVPTQYFTVTLSLAQTDPKVMKPGKRVTAKLNLGSVTGVVLPRHAVFEKDQTFVVFRQEKAGDFKPVPIKLGSSTAGRVLVSEGVAPGDRVALSDPSAQAEEKPKERPDQSATPAPPRPPRKP